MDNIKEKLVELLGDFYGVDPMYFGVDAPAIAKHLADNGVTIKGEEHMTNAEKIRAMSDEELAKIMYGLVGLAESIPFCKNKAECEAMLNEDKVIPDEDCIKCLMAWLQQPAEEDQ